jgi:hypothetical protein
MNTKYAESCNGWFDLRKDLSIAAHDAGNPIVSNGSQQSIGREINNRMFLDVEHFITALEHLLWNCQILLKIDVRLW